MNQIIVGPVLTEKSISDASRGWYTFLVEKSANKGIIASEVGKTFGVKVIKVRTITIPAKTRRVGKQRKETLMPAKKKALVNLAKGQKIELFDISQEAAHA